MKNIYRIINEKDYSDNVGKHIRDLRKKAGLTQQELAEELGFKTKTSICKVESGQGDVSPSTILMLCDIFGVQPNYFFGYPETGVYDATWKDMYEKLIERYEDLHDDYIELSVALATIKKQLNQLDLD